MIDLCSHIYGKLFNDGAKTKVLEENRYSKVSRLKNKAVRRNSSTLYKNVSLYLYRWVNI